MVLLTVNVSLVISFSQKISPLSHSLLLNISVKKIYYIPKKDMSALRMFLVFKKKKMLKHVRRSSRSEAVYYVCFHGYLTFGGSSCMMCVNVPNNFSLHLDHKNIIFCGFYNIFLGVWSKGGKIPKKIFKKCRQNSY
jgi:hypothetical protein